MADPGAPSTTGSPDETARRVEAFVLDGDTVQPCTRQVIEEEPIRLVVNGEPATTLMRTPGGEVELALGYLLTEGLARSIDEVATVAFCREGEFGPAGEVRIQLSGEMPRPLQQRRREVFSSCSLCGLELIEAYADDLATFSQAPGRLRVQDVLRLRDAMDSVQRLYRSTGGSHAAALAPLPVDPESRSTVVREDIGRHNALDKAIGAAAAQRLPLGDSLLMLSGRLSFEMVAKTARAGVGNLAAVGAPSGLGIDLARRLGMFLVGFVRGDTMTVYSGVEALA